MRRPQPAIFLDRDGVLNEPVVRHGKPYPPATVADLKVYADAACSLQRLQSAGFLLVVVTNQPDIARGTADLRSVIAIHAALREQLPIDDIYVCDHDDIDACWCRKPKPGLLLRAADEHGINPLSSFMIGDRWRDVDAGFAAGCRTIWIDRGYDERPPSHAPNARVKSLADAVDWIVGHRSIECGCRN